MRHSRTYARVKAAVDARLISRAVLRAVIRAEQHYPPRPARLRRMRAAYGRRSR